jgi:hypothetical protein
VPTLLRAGLKVLLSFYLSWASNTLWGPLDCWDFASMSVIWTSMMQSVPRAQRPQTKMSPRSYVRLFWKRCLTAGHSGFPGLDLGSAAPLVWILGSLQTAEGEKALEAKFLSSSEISLCREITRPPRLHSNALLTLNFCWQPSHWIGKSGGQRAYRRRSASRNY